MQTDTLQWKLQSSSTHGVNTFLTHTTEIDPWSLRAAQELAGQLAEGGWKPVLPTDAEATGVSGGYAQVQRATSITATEQRERFWLVGSIAFTDATMSTALYAELLSGKVEQRLTLGATLANVRAFILGVRWIGGIVQPGAGQRTRIREIAARMVGDYRPLLPPNAWVQVPFFAPNGSLRMSETKMGAVLAPPAPRTLRGRRTRLQVRSRRTGKWRAIAARRVQVGADGSLRIGPHAFTAAADGGYIYLTAGGAVEPTYRLPAADYTALVEKGG